MFVFEPGDFRQEGITEIIRLLLADARNLKKFLARSGPTAAHTAQRLVAGDHIRCPRAPDSQLATQLAQSLEQLGVVAHPGTGIERRLIAQHIDRAARPLR